MPAENKITNVERDKRVTTIYDLLVLGTSRAQIIQYAANKEWDVSSRQIDNYIKQANDCFTQEAQAHREIELGKARRRLEDLYLKTMKLQDYQRALAVQRELNALFGLYAPEKQELQVSIGLLKNLKKSADTAGVDLASVFESMINEFANISAGNSEE